MLKLQFRDRRREAVWLVDQVFTIGKDPANSLMVNDDSIQGFHAEIINKGNSLSIINKTLIQSLWVNDKPVAEKASLKAEDIIKLGTIELELIDPKSLLNETERQSNTGNQQWGIHSSASWLECNTFPLSGKSVIGRDPLCDITLNLEHLSRRHVELEVINGQLFIRDLSSSNGTFVNGKRITESELKPGDKIKLDVITFDVTGPAIAHDPNKTIIRSIPVSKTSGASSTTHPGASNKQATKKKPPAKAAPATPVKTTPVKTTPAKKTGTKVSAARHSKTEHKQERQGNTLKKSQLNNVAKKRLAANGKQDWVSGENQIREPGTSISRIAIVTVLAVIFLGITSVLLIN